MNWARRLELVDTQRVLELGGIVQAEIKVLFNAISCGDLAQVRKLVGVGDVFDPNGSTTLFDKMEQQVVDVRAHATRVGELRVEAEECTKLIEESRARVDDAKRAVDAAMENVNLSHESQGETLVEINKAFLIFHKAAERIIVSDVEEFYRLRKLDEPTRLSMFAYALLFGIIDIHEWPENAYDLSSAKIWWPLVVRSLADTHNVLRSFHVYSIDRSEENTSELQSR